MLTYQLQLELAAVLSKILPVNKAVKKSTIDDHIIHIFHKYRSGQYVM